MQSRIVFCCTHFCDSNLRSASAAVTIWREQIVIAGDDEIGARAVSAHASTS